MHGWTAPDVFAAWNIPGFVRSSLGTITLEAITPYIALPETKNPARSSGPGFDAALEPRLLLP